MTTAPAPKLPAATLWDMDGTIINSEPLWLSAEVHMLERYRIAVPSDIHERLVGQGLTTAARVFQTLGVPLSVDDIVNEWANGVVAGLAETGPLWIDGALEMLDSFQAFGVPSALVTMSVRPIAEAVVELLPAGTFQAIVTGDDVEFEKPHPDPYLRGAAALGVETRHCIAFEDSPPGIAAAAASGAFVFGVPNLLSLEGSDAHLVLPTLSGLDARQASSLWHQHRS